MLKSLPLRAIVFVAFTCMIMLGLQGVAGWNARLAEAEETEKYLVNLAASLAQHVDATIEVADAAVAGVVTQLETDGITPDTLSHLDRQLAAQVAAGGRFRNIIVLGPDGNWLASSLATKGMNFADRAYFGHHRNDPSREPFVGPPIQSRISGDWIITVSRRLRAPDGSFAGVVFASVGLSYFVDHFATYDLGPDSLISLSSTDGVLLARYPASPQFVGQNVAGATVFRRLREQPAGSYLNTSLIDGVSRFTGYRQSGRYPLVVVAAISEEEALRSWRADVRVHMMIATVLATIVALLGQHLIRQMWRNQNAERRVRESEERYHLLLQSGGVTQALYMLDPDGNIESWNASAERIKGYVPAEIIGRNFAMFFTAEDIASGEPARCLAIAHAEGRYSAEGWRVRKDGSRFLARTVIDAIRKEDGTLRGFAKVTDDVTGERIEEEQRRIIIEAAPNGMMIVDEGGIITLANSKVEQIFDYPSGTLVGRPAETLVPEGSRDADGGSGDVFIGQAGAKGGVAGREFIGRRRDGSTVWIEIMMRSVRTPRGAIVVASMYDITERMRATNAERDAELRARQAVEASNASLDLLSRQLAAARDRAEQANRAKSRFLAGMSHELRTPLNGILGYAQLLHMEGGLTARQGARVDAMLEAGKHLLEMITCVLDLSEIEAEHVELRAVAFDVQAVGQACLDLLRPAAEAKGLRLGMVVAPGTRGKLIADQTRVRQVLLNLLGNATKFTSRGAIELRLRASADRSMMRIEVADTGAGIPTEQRHSLFQDFQRLDSDVTRGVEGAGLGLAVSARLANLMGGRLGHEDNPGGGSVFWLELPLDTELAVPRVLPSGADRMGDYPAPMGPLRVLVVDDVLMNRDITSSFMRAAGHAVVCAVSGEEAVAAVSNSDFDVVLMDVRMPGMDGLEATRHIRGLGGMRGCVPIVAVTADAFTEQAEECRRAGMSGHVAKPFTLQALLDSVACAVAGRAPGEVAVPVCDELPVLDQDVFERIGALLGPEAVGTYLRTLGARSEALLDRLGKPCPEGEISALAGAAHALAGSAGMFGFVQLAAAARDLDHALMTQAETAAHCGERLVMAIEAAVSEIGQHLIGEQRVTVVPL